MPTWRRSELDDEWLACDEGSARRWNAPGSSARSAGARWLRRPDAGRRPTPRPAGGVRGGGRAVPYPPSLRCPSSASSGCTSRTARGPCSRGRPHGARRRPDRDHRPERRRQVDDARIVGGTEDVNEGEVVRRRGVTASYLEQNPEGDARTAEAWVLAGRPDVAALDDELRSIEAELARPAVTADLAKMDRVLTGQQAALGRWVEAEDPARGGGEEPADPSSASTTTTSRSRPRRSPAVSGSSPRSPPCLIRDPDLLLLDEPETRPRFRQAGAARGRDRQSSPAPSSPCPMTAICWTTP